MPEENKPQLLLKKQIYPYEYMDSFEKFGENQLLDKEKFYSSLSGEDKTDEECAHAKQVWEAFGCRNLGDYHDLYVATDTLLLADVFENFRKVCMEKYGLDPAHYYSAPGLSWTPCWKRQAWNSSCWQTWTWICLSREGWEVASRWPASATQRRTTCWSKDTTHPNQQTTSHILMRITFTDGQWANPCRRKTSTGNLWCRQKSRSWRWSGIRRKVGYWRWTSNTMRTCTTPTMTTRWRRKRKW